MPFVQPDDKRHPFVEAYRNLRSSLLYMAEAEPRPHTLLVTSSVPNDGKSVTATNLAITLAIGGSRVLLVDADLRKGNLHNRFNIPDRHRLVRSACPQGRLARRRSRKPPSKNSSLLPRGATTQRSSEFFIGPVMEKFLQEAGAGI